MNCDKETGANYDHIYEQQFNKPTGDFGSNLPIFITLDTSQSWKLMIMKIFTV